MSNYSLSEDKNTKGQKRKVTCSRLISPNFFLNLHCFIYRSFSYISVSFNKCIHLCNNSPVKIQVIFITPDSSLECYIIPKRHMDISLIFFQLYLHITCIKRELKLLEISSVRATELIVDVLLESQVIKVEKTKIEPENTHLGKFHSALNSSMRLLLFCKLLPPLSFILILIHILIFIHTEFIECFLCTRHYPRCFLYIPTQHTSHLR